MIPLYILGLLLRFGSQHGYQIKKTIADQLSDFTQIKLSAIYYHLEKMEDKGFLSAAREKDTNKLEKIVYSITDKGKTEFQRLLNGLLELDYKPVFPSDGIFYFSDALDINVINEHLRDYIVKLQAIIVAIEKHKKQTLQFIPDEMKVMAKIIFSHHQYHYQTELNWAVESLKNLS